MKEVKKDPLLGEEGHKQNLNLVLYLNYAFLAFYAVAIFWSFRAYREFKGMAEDFLGTDGLQQMNEQNIIQYGILKPKSEYQRVPSRPRS